MIRASGGRFLKPDDTEGSHDERWKEVEDTMALRKIAHFFRREREKRREEGRKTNVDSNQAISNRKRVADEF